MEVDALLSELADVLCKHKASLHMGENDETVQLVVDGVCLELWEMELDWDFCRIVPLSEDPIIWKRQE